MDEASVSGGMLCQRVGVRCSNCKAVYVRRVMKVMHVRRPVMQVCGGALIPTARTLFGGITAKAVRQATQPYG